MKRKAVLGIMLTLLVVGIFPLATNTGSEQGTQSSYDEEQAEAATTSFASASGSAEVRFDPETYMFFVERGVGVGFRFNTTVELFDVTELFAWQVRVYFNNTLLNATNAHYHPDEPIHTLDYYQEVSPFIDNDYNATHGYVQHSISSLMLPYRVNVTAEDYPLGIGICIIEFEILIEPSSGKRVESNLDLVNPHTFLSKDIGEDIPCTKKNGLYRLIRANIKVPTDYSTIQEAINAADPGNTVFVYNKTYYENVVINKTLILVGQSASLVIVNGTSGTVIYVDDVDDVVIDGFTLSSGGNGISLYKSRNVIILGNSIRENSGHGIHGVASSYSHCSDLIVSGNNITANNGNGINARSGTYSSYANHWVIFGNVINENGGHGIYTSTETWGSCDSWVIHSNVINENGGHGIYTFAFSQAGPHANSWFVYDNDIAENSGDGIWGYNPSPDGSSDGWIVRNNIVNDNGGTGIRTTGEADSWTIYDNIVANNEKGIQLSGGNNILVKNKMINNTYNFGVSFSYIQDVDTSNTVNGKPVYYLTNWAGGQIPADAGYIALIDSANITVENFNLTHNEQGIMLVRTENITLRKIYAAKNVYGIYLQESYNFTVHHNQVSNNTYGVYLKNSSNSTIYSNKAINNTYGIYLRNSTNCTITGNTIERNDYGTGLYESYNNKVYHNNLINNTNQIYDESWENPFWVSPSINVWNSSYPSGGNYWSDHTGPDWCKGTYQNETGSDGIVDANMTIDQNNIDCYPLSAPWSSPIDIIIPGNTMYRGTNITLTFTLEFSASWIGYSLDGQASVTITGNITLTGLPYGWHHIIVYANDTSGNMESSVPVHFAITFLTDINYDQTVDLRDLIETTGRYGSVPGDPRWNVYADVNQDGIIDIEDVQFVADDYGITWY